MPKSKFDKLLEAKSGAAVSKSERDAFEQAFAESLEDKKKAKAAMGAAISKAEADRLKGK